MRYLYYLFCVLAIVFLYSCNDQIDTFLEDNYQRADVPPYKITEVIDGKLSVSFLQRNTPGINSAPATIVNSLQIDNVSNTQLNKLGLLLEVFRKDSTHVHSNLLLAKLIVIESGIAPGGRQTIPLDSVYSEIPSLKDLDLEIIHWNNENMFASGLYEGQFRAFKDQQIYGGFANVSVNYRGEVRMSVPHDKKLTFIKGICFASDSLFIGEALRISMDKESDVSASFSKINNDGMLTTLMLADKDVYDSILLNLKLKKQ